MMQLIAQLLADYYKKDIYCYQYTDGSANLAIDNYLHPSFVYFKGALSCLDSKFRDIDISSPNLYDILEQFKVSEDYSDIKISSRKAIIISPSF